jgi:hypothetical protein
MPVREPARPHDASAARDIPGATQKSHGTSLRGGSPRSRGPLRLRGSPLLSDRRFCPCCENPFSQSCISVYGVGFT